MTTVHADNSAVSLHQERGRPATWYRRNERRLAPYLFLAPFLVLFLAFTAGPVLFAVWIGFHKWSGFGTMRWVGTANYTKVFHDVSFHHATYNTLWYAFASLFIVCPLALVLALALNSRHVYAKDLLRTGYFLPIVLSPVVISLVFSILFNREFGLINATLRGIFGLSPVNWMGVPKWARTMIIVLIVWRWTGYIMIYFLAGLQGISRDLYEAAQVDGAGAWRQFLNITLPGLRPVVTFVSVVVLAGSAQIFEEPYLLTKGGPGEATLSIANYIQKEAFERLNYGGASAAGVILFIAIFALMQIQLRFFNFGQEDS